MAVFAALVLATISPLGSQTAHRVPRVDPAPTSQPVAAVLTDWNAKSASCKARFAAITAIRDVAANLRERAKVDQCLRLLFSAVSFEGLDKADGRAIGMRMFGQIAEVDASNTAYLKSVLPRDGWFHIARDGKQVAADAWLIVQHSQDQAFQRDVVARMAPLAARGEVDGADYALLYDRTEMFAGRPQYYGSQYRCVGGEWTLAPLRDAAGVEARRKALGMATMAENLARIRRGGSCY